MPRDVSPDRDDAPLRYVSDAMPGISRRRCGKGFAYFYDGQHIGAPPVVERIKALAVPPAYHDVWICPWPDGHLQATGRDAKGRKQYRYHPAWRAHRETTKFAGLAAFARTLPAIRAHVARDLSGDGPTKTRVLATVVRLLDQSGIRIGNRCYREESGAVGLTTMTAEHLEIEGPAMHFAFTGKGGVTREVDLRDRRVAAAVRGMQDLPGQDLFQWRDPGGALHPVRSEDVNAYLAEAAGAETNAVTAKTFRTWAATVIAARALMEGPAPEGRTAPDRKAELAAIERVAAVLGNTRAVAEASYVHPELLAAFRRGDLHDGTEPPGGALLAKRGLSTLEDRVATLISAPARSSTPSGS